MSLPQELRSECRVGFVAVLVVAFPFVAFPPVSPGDGAVLNLYTPLVGFRLAFVAGYVHPSVGRVSRPSSGEAMGGERWEGMERGRW